MQPDLMINGKLSVERSTVSDGMRAGEGRQPSLMHTVGAHEAYGAACSCCTYCAIGNGHCNSCCNYASAQETTSEAWRAVRKLCA